MKKDIFISTVNGKDKESPKTVYNVKKAQLSIR